MFEGRSIALYGRFRVAPRATFAQAIEAAGGRIARDLTRGSDLFVVGLGAYALAASGALGERLRTARARGAPIWGEERLRDHLFAVPTKATAPLFNVLKGVSIDEEALSTLAAFDVIRLDGPSCRFEDVKAIREAAALLADGLTALEVVDSLRAARRAPPGRRRVVSLGDGAAALSWEDDDSLTALDGQRLLPLDLAETSEDLFDAAAEAEAEDDVVEAVRLYEAAARADRKDPIAPFNLANLQAAAGEHDAALLNYRIAIARDPAFAEARYNFGAALEAVGRLEEAEAALEAALEADPEFADAMFNLAQLKLARDAFAEAQPLFEAYARSDAPEAWREKARRALHLISSRLRAG